MTRPRGPRWRPRPTCIDLVAVRWVTIDACGRLTEQRRPDAEAVRAVARHPGPPLAGDVLRLAEPPPPGRRRDLGARPRRDRGLRGRRGPRRPRPRPGGRAAGRPGRLHGVRRAAGGRAARAGQAAGRWPSRPRPSDTTTGWGGASDYAALGAHADLVTVMAYEYHGSWSGPGPIAPYAWVEQVAAFAVSQIPPEKVLLGLAAYGFDWNTTSGGARYLGWPEAAALGERYGVADRAGPFPDPPVSSDTWSMAVTPAAQDRPLRELRGVVERITYQNPENGYTVARLAPERPESEAEAARGDDRLVTVVGTLADLTPGEAIVAHGWWRNDPKHGWQFQAMDYRTTLPATLQGMKKYLGSGPGQGHRAGQRRPHRGRLRRGDLRRDRRRPEPPDRGAGHRPGAGRADRRDLGRAAPHPRGDGGAPGLRHLDLAGRPHLQEVRGRQRHGHHPGAVPPGARGLGHRLQDGRQDRPGRRHRPGRPRAAPGGRAARAGRGGRRGPHPAARRPTSSAGRRRCSGPRRRPSRDAVGALLETRRRRGGDDQDGRTTVSSRWRRSPAPSPGWPPACTALPGRRDADARGVDLRPASTGTPPSAGWPTATA